MLRHLRLLAVAGGAFVAAASLAAQAPLHRVVPSGAALGDPRVSAPRTLDAPAVFTASFKTRADWEARAAALRRQVQVAVGLWPMPERGPVKATVHGRVVRDGYTIEKVSFASLPGHYVTGNLYRPTGAAGRRPAVLSPHGHWENGRLLTQPPDEIEKALKSGGEKTEAGARHPLQARLAGLARLGAVVFMYDMVGYADSTAMPHREGFKDAAAELRLQSFMGLQAWNGLRALDFLAALPDVDPGAPRDHRRERRRHADVHPVGARSASDRGRPRGDGVGQHAGRLRLREHVAAAARHQQHRAGRALRAEAARHDRRR